MSIQVVAGPDTREFALAVLDFRLTMATECRRRAAAVADQSVIDEQGEREAEARHHVHLLTRHIDALLENRCRVS